MKYSVEDLRLALFRVTDALIEAKDLLTDIDNISGDGDLGISMEKGAAAIRRELELPGEALQENRISDLLMRCSVTLNKEAPSTMGTLTSLAMADVAKVVDGLKDETGKATEAYAVMSNYDLWSRSGW